MRKTFLSILVFFLFSFTTSAQLLRPFSASPAFTDNLARITQAFRTNYYQVQGEALSSQDDVEMYSSTIVLPGASHCVIYRFHSKTDSTASWQAVMYEGENYKEALKAYKNTCKQVDKCKVTLLNNIPASYSGKMDEPDTNLRFASSVFRLKTNDAVYDRFYAEVELLNTGYDQWEVHLNLQNKKDDDEK
jgi:hypothetical protein